MNIAKILDKLVADGLVKDRDAATKAVVLYGTTVGGMTKQRVQLAILADAVSNLKKQLSR